MSIMSGKEIRMRRIFKDDGKTVISALDMGMFSGTVPGLEDVRAITKTVVDAGADAIICGPGWAKATADIYGGKCGLILRITGGVTRHTKDSLNHTLTTTVEEAVALGADAVMNMVFVGDESNPHEHEQLTLMRELSWECHKYGMVLFPELLHTNWEDQNDPGWIDACVRAGFEYGADAVKVIYAHDDFEKIVKACPVPVVMAGGPKSRSLQEMVAEVIQAGGRGCAIGRNVYGSEDPAAVIKRLRKTVHGE
ncbi:MAG: hypothetical protein IJX52_07455 [Oscillibacter sp.]|nr:hypothetical protein [Oscillibacter sp.]